MNTTTAKATPTKLRNGKWGAKVQGHTSEGQIIEITTRSGKSWTAQVTKVYWTGDGVSIVATSTSDTSGAAQRRSRSNRCDHCGGQLIYGYCPGFDCDGDI